MFAYQGKPDDLGDPNAPPGFDAVRVLRSSLSLSLADYPVHTCKYAAGGALFCRTNSPAAAASTRSDGSDKLMVAYLLQPSLGSNHSVLSAKMLAPTGTLTSLPAAPACPNATCPLTSLLPIVRAAYNKHTNQFLAVVVTPQLGLATSPLVGQIYDGTTGALGPWIDFGDVPTDQALGLASNDNLSSNPTQSWTVVLRDRAFSVRSNGTFTQSSVVYPNAVQGHWTFQQRIAPAYEFLSFDGSSTSTVGLLQFDEPAGPLQGSAVGNYQQPTYGEAMAYSRRTNNEISVWSGGECAANGQTNCPRIFWRLSSRD